MPNFLTRGIQRICGRTQPQNIPAQNTNRAPATTTYTPAPACPVVSTYPHRSAYDPSRVYSIAELSHIAVYNIPRAEDRPHFIRSMVSSLQNQYTTQHEKAVLCKHLANCMREEDYVDFMGATRQANYFASYCVDLTLRSIDIQYSAAKETDLRNLLTLWSTTLCPSQTEFNLDGIIYSRSEISAMLNGPQLITRALQRPPAELAQRMEQRLQGVGTSSVRQTVHDQTVLANGSRVLNIIKSKHGLTTPLSAAEIIGFLEPEIVSKVTSTANASLVRNALKACSNNIARDNNWAVNICPQAVLGHLCQYINATSDATIKTNLLLALFDRLREISIETPCTAGILQRLLDVPSGIDPDMNFAGKARQVGEDIATVAAKTYEQFTTLIDEAIEAIPEEQRNIQAQNNAVGAIGQSMFEARVTQDFKRLGGLSEAEIAPHRERLKAGFTAPS